VASPWYRSKWFRIGGIILFLGLIVAVALPLLVAVDRFRPLLIQLIETNTGRSVEIDSLKLHLVPTVHVEAVNVRLENSQGFPHGDAIIVQSVDLDVGLRALLSRKLDVTSIVLSGIQIHLISDPTGRTNLELPVLLGKARPRGTAVAAGGTALLTLDHVGAVAVTNVKVTMASFDPRTQRTRSSLTLSGVNARIRPMNPSAPDLLKRLEITWMLRGVTITMPSLAKPVQLQAGDLLIKNNAARGTFSATLDTTQIAGTVAVKSLHPSSVITFAVAVPDLDVATVERLFAHRAGTGIAHATTRRRLLARGTLTIAHLVIPPLEATQMHGRVSVNNNTIQIDSYTLATYGGTVQGAAALDYAAARLPVMVTTRARGVNVERLANAISPNAANKITGTLDVDLTMATQMGVGFEKALSGAGTFAVRNGSFPRLNLKTTLEKLAMAVHLINVPTGPTRFSYLGGDVRIAQQRVYSNALRLEAQGLEGSARGSFGFNETLDYVATGAIKSPPSALSGGTFAFVGQMLRTFLPGTSGAAGIQVPFTIQGTFDHPKFSPAGTPAPMGG
jgi:uncharacterized protein involved in outer membrane biogenesis